MYHMNVQNATLLVPNMIIRTKDGKKIVLRKPRMSDLRGFLNFINSLVEEDAQILCNRKMKLSEERKWLKNQLNGIKEKKIIQLIAEIDGKLIGSVEIKKREFRKKHVGELSISIIKDYRNLGIGKEMIRAILELARRDKDLKLIYLTVSEKNKVAQHVYERMGFKKVARLRNRIFYKDKYIDEIVMDLQLKKMV